MKRRGCLRGCLVGVGIFLILFGLLPFLIPVSTEGIDPRSLVVDGGRFITVEGLQTYVVERGEPDAPALVLVHGAFGSTFTWRNQLDALAEAGFRVIAYDRPGSGLTDKPRDFRYSQRNQADFAASLLDALAVDQAIWVGHSAGGNVITHLAVHHPERIARLVYVDGAVLGMSGPPAPVAGLIGVAPVYRWAQIGMRTVFSRETLAGFLRGFYADPSQATPEVVEGYWRTFQTPSWEYGLLGQSRDATDTRFDEATLRGITLPTLLIWGERDTVTPLAQGEQLAALLPDARLMVIPNVGHQPMEEAPQTFNVALLAYLTSDS